MSGITATQTRTEQRKALWGPAAAVYTPATIPSYQPTIADLLKGAVRVWLRSTSWKKALLDTFADVFADNDEDCTHTSLVLHDKDTGETCPVRLRRGAWWSGCYRFMSFLRDTWLTLESSRAYDLRGRGQDFSPGAQVWVYTPVRKRSLHCFGEAVGCGLPGAIVPEGPGGGSAQGSPGSLTAPSLCHLAHLKQLVGARCV